MRGPPSPAATPPRIMRPHAKKRAVSPSGLREAQPEHEQHGRVALRLELRRARDLRLADRADAGGDGDVLRAVHRLGRGRRRETGAYIDLPQLVEHLRVV